MLNRQDKKCTSIYTSCIKINGIPILPPLLTAERRKELQGYKKAAVEVEKRLQGKRKEFSKSKDVTVASVCKANTELSQRSHYKTLEQQITFSANNLENTKLPSVRVEEVPYKNQNPSLTINIIEVSEFSDEGVRIFNDSSSSVQTSDVTLTSSLLNQKHDVNNTVANDHSCISNESSVSQRPRVRSNSYTLEAPSPNLLSHFEKEHAIKPDCVPNTPDNSHVISNGHHNVKSAVVTPKNSPKSKGEFLEESIDTTCLILNDNDCTNEIFQQNVMKTSSPNNSNTESEILNILNNLPGNYSRQIIELLEKQKMEQQMRLESYHKLKERLSCDNELLFNEESTVNVSCVTVKSCHDKSNGNSSEVFEDCVSRNSFNQNSFYSPKSNGDTLNGTNGTGEALLIDLDDDCSNRTQEYASVENSFNFKEHLENPSRQLVINPVYQVHHFAVNHFINSNNCDRELFFENNLLQINYAASKIGAAIKGYLVRRLLRTEKVRALTQTIKDALICAIELHDDNVENINESDVELHRRLIQQVSAACNAFHDVFFALTVKEQMAIIAQDRLRLKNEKLRKRPKLNLSRSHIKMTNKA